MDGPVEHLDRIRLEIPDFAGYEGETARRRADEQIRCFVGERLAALPAVELDAFAAEAREVYDRVLLRCEFVHVDVFRTFEADPSAERIAQILVADLLLLEAAKALDGSAFDLLDDYFTELDRAFDQRDEAMRRA